MPPRTDDLRRQLQGMRRRRTLLRRMLVGAALVYAAGLTVLIGLLLLRDSPGRPGRHAAAGRAPGVTAPAVLTNTTYDPPAMRQAIRQWQEADDQLDEARQWIQKGRLDTAGLLLRDELAKAPHNAAILYELAQLEAQQDALQPARQHLQQLLAVDPQRKAAVQLLASVYSRSQLHEQALALANWILASDADCLAAHEVAGRAYLKANRLEQALVHFRKCAAAEPDNLPAQKQYADVLLALKDYEKAGPLYAAILKKKPEDAWAYRQLALCYANQKRVDQTVATLIQATYNVGPRTVGLWFHDPGFNGVRREKLFALLEKQLNVPQATAPAIPSNGPQAEAEAPFDMQRIRNIQSMMQPDQ